MQIFKTSLIERKSKEGGIGGEIKRKGGVKAWEKKHTYLVAPARRYVFGRNQLLANSPGKKKRLSVLVNLAPVRDEVVGSRLGREAPLGLLASNLDVFRELYLLLILLLILLLGPLLFEMPSGLVRAGRSVLDCFCCPLKNPLSPPPAGPEPISRLALSGLVAAETHHLVSPSVLDHNLLVVVAIIFDLFSLQESPWEHTELARVERSQDIG